MHRGKQALGRALSTKMATAVLKSVLIYPLMIECGYRDNQHHILLRVSGPRAEKVDCPWMMGQA